MFLFSLTSLKLLQTSLDIKANYTDIVKATTSNLDFNDLLKL